MQLNATYAKLSLRAKRGNTSHFIKHLHAEHSVNVKQCGVIDCFSKAANVSNFTSSALKRNRTVCPSSTKATLFIKKNKPLVLCR